MSALVQRVTGLSRHIPSLYVSTRLHNSAASGNDGDGNNGDGNNEGGGMSGFGSFQLRARYKIDEKPERTIPQQQTSEDSQKSPRKRILITGANGSIATKLVQFWRNKHELTLVDMNKPSGMIGYCMSTAELPHNFIKMDLKRDSATLKNVMSNVDTVVHLAAQNPFADCDWSDATASMDINNNVMLTAMEVNRDSESSLERMIFASSNHVMGGYRNEGPTLSQMKPGFDDSALLDINLPMKVGTVFTLDDGFDFDSTIYGSAKAEGERLAAYIATHSTIQNIVIRIGWCQPGLNEPSTLNATGTPKDSSLHTIDLPSNATFDDRSEVTEWFRHMWLSNHDLFRLYESAATFTTPHSALPYTIVNGVSNNNDSRWCLKNDIGYTPTNDVHTYTPPIPKGEE